MVSLGINGFCGFSLVLETPQYKCYFSLLRGIDVNIIPTDLTHLKTIKDWLISQQRRYRSNELKEEQIKLLTEAGVKLEKVSKQEQRWEALYELLVLFKKEHGHCRVTTSYQEEFRNWVGTQRVSYKEKILDQNKIDRLWHKNDFINCFKAAIKKTPLILPRYV